MKTVISVASWMTLLFVNGYCQDYTVTPITTSSGLYYEKVGEVLLSNSNWQFVTSVDYQGYLLFYQYLLQQANEIYTFCQMLNSTVCDERYNTIRANLNRIEERDESMAHFLGITENRRVKRFWSAIGNFFKRIGRGIVKTIFGGGSSSADLSAYNRAIGNLQSGQRELENQLLLQRTLFVIDSEKKNFQIDWLNKTQGEIQNKISTLEGNFEKDKTQKEKEIKELQNMLGEVGKKLKMQEETQKKLAGKVDKIENHLLEVDKNIKLINNKIANNSAKINRLEIISKIGILSTNFILSMYQFETEQRTLYDVIKNANKGDMDQYILTPLNLIKMLEGIQPHLPEGRKFPHYPNIENARKLYKVIKPSVYLFEDKIIFILKIPLVYSKTFNIHKMTSLPMTAGGSKFIFILPQDPYLIIDNNNLDYMLLSVNNFRDFCKELEPSKYICKQIQEISHSYSSQDCEVILFKSPKYIPDSCNKRIMSLDKPIFLQLQQSGTWIYAIPDIENIIINCNKKRTALHLTASGFVNVNGDCLIRTDNYDLMPLDEFTKPVEFNFSSPLNLRDFIDLEPFDEIKVKNMKSIQVIYPFDLKRLEEISHAVVNIDMGSSSLYYTILIIPAILVITFMYLVYKKKVNFEKLINLGHFTNASNHITPSAPPDITDLDNDKIKIKVRGKKDDIKKVSIHEHPSETDPEAEYLTVRFKVKKDKNEPSVSNNKILNSKREPQISQLKTLNNQLDREKLPPKPRRDEQYLNELRKVKPNVK